MEKGIVINDAAKKLKYIDVYSTDSGLLRILATALVASLRMSEAITASTGTFVYKFNVGIFIPISLFDEWNGKYVVSKPSLLITAPTKLLAIYGTCNRISKLKKPSALIFFFFGEKFKISLWFISVNQSFYLIFLNKRLCLFCLKYTLERGA